MALHRITRVFSRRSCLSTVLLMTVGLIVTAIINTVPAPFAHPSSSAAATLRVPSRRLLQADNANTSGGAPQPATTTAPSAANSGEGDSQFPPDAFTIEQQRQGAAVLHAIGMVYMFFALAVVCEEFFVPSLDVITEKLAISEDVAGATFMAAGGSAPELFTSIIGVFFAKNDVGIGTIVGSAVFNLLFVIAMCVLFSRTVLELTWWPLARDFTFYSVGLVLVIQFFKDNQIYWWESLLLFGWYIAYCTFMKFNAIVERGVKSIIPSKKVGRADQNDIQRGSKRRPSTPNLHNGSKFRQGLLQLMIHTIDPLHDGKIDEHAAQLQALASFNVRLDSETAAGSGTNGTSGTQSQMVCDQSQPDTTTTAVTDLSSAPVDLGSATVSTVTAATATDTATDTGITSAVETQDEAEEKSKPLDLSWPTTLKGQLSYVLVAPIIFVLWLTLPDCRSPRGRRFYMGTFIGSIIWIAIFSYLMVWWASVLSNAMKIPAEVMGLTILAAGTSVPDLITSVIVARKGFGDMAVSSSVGSNIFDICVGLPVPWLLDVVVKMIQQLVAGESLSLLPNQVKSEGMACNVLMLFAMLLLVLATIAGFRWRMNRALGTVMVLLYFLYLALALSFEMGALKCTI